MTADHIDAAAKVIRTEVPANRETPARTPEEFAVEVLAEWWHRTGDDERDLADLIRERDAEVRADERAKVLADVDNIARASSLSATDARHIIEAIQRMSGLEWEYHDSARRLVSPWEPTP